MQPPNAFELLGVNAVASDDAVRKAFRERSLLVHPDKGGSKEDMRELHEARSRILEPGGRASELKRTRPVPPRGTVELVGLKSCGAFNGMVGAAGEWDGLRLQVLLESGAIKAHPVCLQRCRDNCSSLCHMGDLSFA